MLQPVFVIVCMTQDIEKFNLQILHDRICRRGLKIQFQSLNLYFRGSRISPYNFSFVILVCQNQNKYV